MSALYLKRKRNFQKDRINICECEAAAAAAETEFTILSLNELFFFYGALVKPV